MTEPLRRSPSARRIATVIAATPLLVVLLSGVPWLLFCWGWLAELTTINWGSVFLHPDDGRIMLGVLSLVGWLAWVMLTLATAGELLHTISRGRIRFRVPGMGWLRPVIVLLVTAALSPVLTANAFSSPPDAPAAITVPAEIRPEDSATPFHTARQEPIGWREYEVQPGDGLWDIAAREFDAGKRWHQLVTANPGIDIDHPSPPGTILRLPMTVRMERGDSLWHLAKRHLGDPECWSELYEANRDRIPDPDEIDTGWAFTLPGTDVAAPDVQSRPVQPPTTVEPAPTPVPSSEATPMPLSTSPPAEDPGPVAKAPSADENLDPSGYFGPIGGLLTAGVITGLSLRRKDALHVRPLGRRSIPVPPPLERFWTALGRRGTQPQTDDGPVDLSPIPVLLGWCGEEEVRVTLEENRCLWLSGTQLDALGMAADTWTSLLCLQWSSEINVVAAHPRGTWAEAVDDPRPAVLPSADEALAQLERLCVGRRVVLGSDPFTAVRSDPDRTTGFAPTVFIFCDSLTPQQAVRVTQVLELGRVGVSVMAPVQRRPPVPESCLELWNAQAATLDPGKEFEPQLIPGPARHTLVESFASSIAPDSELAFWWRDGLLPPDENPLPGSGPIKDPPVTAEPHSPMLLLLREAGLVACDGPRPSRAAGRCLECCAWLFSNPEATPTQMWESLMVAESTRRSNMSRLRGWPGRGPEGEHLPDTYSGHIRLIASVPSGRERFQSLFVGGVNRASDSLLAEAPALVRGIPLGSFEFQWSWAEQMRSGMVSMIVDAAVVPADRCTVRWEYELADWAISQGVRTAGEVEPLVVRWVRSFAQRGDRAEVDRQILQLMQSTHASERDLGPDSVRMIQKALQVCRQGPRRQRSGVE